MTQATDLAEVLSELIEAIEPYVQSHKFDTPCDCCLCTAIANAEAALASHAPSALNRNDTIEYWMTRATTAELKLQEFAKVLYEISAKSAAEVGGSMADQLNEPGDHQPTPVLHKEGDSE